MTKVLSYELSAVPLSLFHLNGDMRKTNKRVLLHELEINQLLPLQEFVSRTLVLSLISWLSYKSMATKDVVTFYDFFVFCYQADF